MNKIDKNLQKSFVLEQKDNEKLCLIRANNFLLAKQFFEKHKIKVHSQYKFINVFAVFLKQKHLNLLQNSVVVDFVYKSCNVNAMVDVSKKIIGLDNTKYTGSGVNVAIIDTGIKQHLDFVVGKNRIIKFVDLCNGKTNPYDDNGHGTFVAGVLGGSGLAQNKKYSGFAPDCNFVIIKALNENGEANATNIIKAMEYVYDNAKSLNIKVVCMSFGSEPLGYNDPIMQASEKLWDRGVVVVAAAGNSGPENKSIKSPGISSKIITVGGFNDNRIDKTINKNFFEIASFSSRGPALNKIKPDLVAPSVDITSCDINDFYTKCSGTSVATPMIAGICAVVLEKYKNMKPDALKKALIKSCKPIEYNFNNEGFGYPYINLL